MYFSPDAQGVIALCAQKAKDLGHSYIGTAHLLLALAESTSNAGALLRREGVDPIMTQEMAAVLYGKGTSGLPLPQTFQRKCAGCCGMLRWRQIGPVKRKSGTSTCSLRFFAGKNRAQGHY